MKETIAQFLKVTKFPFKIKDKHGNTIYYEEYNGWWYKQEYDLNGNVIYFENSKGYWTKREYDSNNNYIYFENSINDWYKYEYDLNGNVIYFENSNGYWFKKEYDSTNKEIYYENSHGTIRDNRPKVELTLDEIANKLGINVSQLKIKK